MIVCLDWDGTLVDPVSQQWLENADWAVGRMLRAGWKVVVCSCRASWPEGLASIEAKLAQAGLGRVGVSDRKPTADVYVDDRALTFTGDWAQMLGQIREAPAA